MRRLFLSLLTVGLLWGFSSTAIAQSPPPCPKQLLFQMFGTYAYSTINCPGKVNGACTSSPHADIQYFNGPVSTGCDPSSANCTQCLGPPPTGTGIDGTYDLQVDNETNFTWQVFTGTKMTRPKYFQTGRGANAKYFVAFKFSIPWVNQIGQRLYLSSSIAFRLKKKPSGRIFLAERIDGKEIGTVANPTYDLLQNAADRQESYAIPSTRAKRPVMLQIQPTDPLSPPLPPIDTFGIGSDIIRMDSNGCYCWPQ